jgi:GAF domain-containing protein
MRKFTANLLKPRTLLAESEIQYWRERIVAVTLVGAAILGTGAYGYNLYLAVQNQTWVWIIIYTITYVGVITIALSPQLHYNFRAGTMLLLLYLLGLISAFQYGSAGDARIWFVGFSVLTGIFLGLRSGLIATLISTGTLLLVGFGMSGGWIAAPQNTAILNPQNFSSWLSTAIPFLAIGLISVLALSVILNGLNRSLQVGGKLTQELEIDRERLERRSHDLERRETQVRTAAEISRTISGELDPGQLFSQVVNLIKDRFNLYYVGVFLVDEEGEFAILQEGTGEAGRTMLEAGHKLPIGGSSMIGWAISRRQARIALDVGREAVRFENPILPETRSELALPMISGTQVLGAITVQSDQPEAFDEDDIIILQSVADSLAVAVENARLFQQTEANFQEIRKLHQQYLGEAWSEVLERSENLSFTYENPQRSPIPDELEMTNSSIVKPLILRGQHIGNLILETDNPTWDAEDEALVESVAVQAALALENVRLIEATQRSAHHDRIVADLSGKAWSSANVDTILKTTLSELVTNLQASEGLITLEVPETNPESQNT